MLGWDNSSDIASQSRTAQDDAGTQICTEKYERKSNKKKSFFVSEHAICAVDEEHQINFFSEVHFDVEGRKDGGNSIWTYLHMRRDFKEVDERKVSMKVSHGSLEYVNYILKKKDWVKEPFIKPFDVVVDVELPNCHIEIGPHEMLVINITPEFISVLEEIAKNQSKDVTSEFYNNKGKCVIQNFIVMLKSCGETKEVQLILERKFSVQLEDFDTIRIDDFNTRKCKKAFVVTKSGSVTGAILVKTKL
ncbi:hypothetical protein EIN_401760 [Entamoeba invadens IP1]|uniref:Uncharacterized protein n=1 Tax=Entamoeba invadens IP1 TaxID=370355 RepID=L7FNN0_ENTIV|nr:hypothetical protein EIN_401760 [Entamoeba invadens IP1]ELP88638.1 hypothetical protein EIN_401760 [Entamoeba invadens IP1]|eukprot:XP_004255409.1 hypothetical protein EIN_401760 [Entamoeba invadens IP1]